jgi:hypothetical protein
MLLRLRRIGVLLVPTVALAAACERPRPIRCFWALSVLGYSAVAVLAAALLGKVSTIGSAAMAVSMVMAAMVATAVMAAMAVMAARDMLGVFRMTGTSTAAVVTVEVGVRTGGADSLYLPDSTQPQRSGFCCGLY